MTSHIRSSNRSEMHRLGRTIAGLCVVMAVLWAGPQACRAADSTPTATDLNLIPWPQSLQRLDGAMRILPTTRIVYNDEKLRPLAALLAEDMRRCFGQAPALATGEPAAGDISLALTSEKMADEQYELAVEKSAQVKAASYRGLAMGTVTLLQAMDIRSGTLWVPCMKINDQPQEKYRAVQVDLYQRPFPLQVLFETVELARLYKMNYVYYHDLKVVDFLDSDTITEKQRQNRLARENRSKLITLAQLRQLVEYARVRGIRIVPDTGIAMRSTSKLTQIEGINDSSEQPFWDRADELFAKIAIEFPDSEYIHCGAMAGEATFADTPENRAKLKKFGLRNGNDWFIHLTNEYSRLARKHGKNAIAWEGILIDPRDRKAPIQLSKDVIFCIYSLAYYDPERAVRDGYRIINCAWKPLYIVQAHHWAPNPQTIYAWNVGQASHNGPGAKVYQVDPKNPLLLGAMLCFWEDVQESLIPILRPRVPAVAERTWNPGADKSFADFQARAEACDQKVQKIMFPVQFKPDGLVGPDVRDFTDKVTLTLHPTIPGKIRYRLDTNWDKWVGQDKPASDGLVYDKPLTLTDTTIVLAQLYDDKDQPVGYPTQVRYARIDPVTTYRAFGGFPAAGWSEMPDFAKLPLIGQGVLGRMTNERFDEVNRPVFAKNGRFGAIDISPWNLYNPHAIELKGQIQVPQAGAYRIGILQRDGLAALYIGGQLAARRTVVSNQPHTYFEGRLEKGVYPFTIQSMYRVNRNELSILYQGPDMAKPTGFGKLMLSIRDFRPAGELLSLKAPFEDTRLKGAQNLAFNKPVTATGEPQDACVPANAVDGLTDNESGWHSAPYPQSLTVDLQGSYDIDAIRVCPYVDPGRYYQYTVEVSSDGKQWRQVVDQSKNNTPSTKGGVLFHIPPTPATSVRINMLKNSANEGVHLNELMVYGTAAPTGKDVRTLSGVVKHASSGKPIADLTLLIDRVSGQGADSKYERLATVLTDAKGHFTVRFSGHGVIRVTSDFNGGTFADGELLYVNETIPDFGDSKEVTITSDISKQDAKDRRSPQTAPAQEVDPEP